MDFKKVIKSILPKTIISFLRNILVNPILLYFFRAKFKNKINKIHKKNQNAIIFMATPTHGNLGDHAIVYAEKKLLTHIGLEERIIEVSNGNYFSNKQYLKRIISPDDLIIVDGGGNLGTLWPLEDDKISEIIEDYHTNPIIVFPQTCYYNEEDESKKRLLKNVNIYALEKRLLITLRDRRSYEFCVNNFQHTRFMCVPDIVLYLNKLKIESHSAREGVLLCFREDLEGVMSLDNIERIKKYLVTERLIYTETSTVLKYAVNIQQRDTELLKKWSEFASSKLIITDRLHGMIFAIITNTPCLAIDNLSMKVSGVYNMIPEITEQ